MSKFSFKPLEESDIDLLYHWLNLPHVSEIWYENLSYEETRKKYLQRLDSDWIFSFIIHCDNQPIGFIHYYYADKVGHGWWPNAKPGEAGIDLFIAEQAYLNKGYGALLLKEFIKLLSKDRKLKTLFVDPAPDNVRAIRCYEKCGFKAQGEIDTPNGKVLLMQLDPQDKKPN
ncbi:MAG: family N-acetyltransferase [Gammaproteobacteria bacterium]|jgi:RimJ/RimL family protein N-acetyltransferase|nr:family N-acetyltransferase [Gammaproteobacteria bacterium]